MTGVFRQEMGRYLSESVLFDRQVVGFILLLSLLYDTHFSRVFSYFLPSGGLPQAQGGVRGLGVDGGEAQGGGGRDEGSLWLPLP